MWNFCEIFAYICVILVTLNPLSEAISAGSQWIAAPSFILSHLEVCTLFPLEAPNTRPEEDKIKVQLKGCYQLLPLLCT